MDVFGPVHGIGDSNKISNLSFAVDFDLLCVTRVLRNERLDHSWLRKFDFDSVFHLRHTLLFNPSCMILDLKKNTEINNSLNAKETRLLLNVLMQCMIPRLY